MDSLAFGHCDYPYRNLGRLTKLQVKQTQDAFEVTVDDKSCFKTDKVSPPSSSARAMATAQSLFRSNCLQTIILESPLHQPRRPTLLKYTNSSFSHPALLLPILIITSLIIHQQTPSPPLKPVLISQRDPIRIWKAKCNL